MTFEGAGRFGWWCAALLLLPFPCAAEPQASLSGWVAGLAGVADEPFDDRKQTIGLRGQLEGDVVEGDLRAHAVLQYPTDTDLGDNTKTTVVREAWARGSTPEFDLTLGRQLLPEGRSDWIRPQAQFAPRDYTQLTPLQANQRLGLPAARLDYYPGTETTLTLAAIRQDRGDVLFADAARQLPDDKPLEDDPAPGGLLRVEHREGEWELGMTAASGASVRPAVRLDGAVLRADSPRQRRLSVDGSYNLSGDVLRWDISYIRNDVDDHIGLPSSEWIGALGLDSRVWTDAMLNLQVIHRSSDLPALSSVPQQAAIQVANRRLYQAYRPAQTWLTVNLRQQIRETHEIEAGYLQGENGERANFLRWSWAFIDRWKFSLMAISTEGGEDTFAGSMSPSNILFSELCYYF